MKFSTPAQIIGMVIIWALALIVYDKLFNVRLFEAVRPESDQSGALKPMLRIQINHLCCSGCYGPVEEALKKFDWLANISYVRKHEKELPSQQQANSSVEEGKEKKPASAYSGGVTADLVKPTQAEFVALTKALRESGNVANSIEISGVPHFALEAAVPHMCCKLCENAAEEAITPQKDGTLQWLDKAGPSHASLVDHTITAYVPYKTAADAGELLRELDNAGFPPSTLRLVMEKDAISPPK